MIKIPNWPLVWRADNFKFNITIKMIVWRSSYSILEYSPAPIWHQEIIYIPLSRWRTGARAPLNENSFLLLLSYKWSGAWWPRVWPLIMGAHALTNPHPLSPGLISSESLNLSHEKLTLDMMRCRVTSLQYWTSQVTALCIINIPYAWISCPWPLLSLSPLHQTCVSVSSPLHSAPGPQPRPAPGHSTTLSVASEQPTSKHLCDLLWTHAELHDKYKVWQTIDFDEQR